MQLFKPEALAFRETWGALAISAVIMTLVFYLWLFFNNSPDPTLKSLATPLVCLGFLPFLFLAFVHWQSGLILSLIALPFIHTPPLPLIGFLSGFSDWLLTAAGMGFFISRFKSSWKGFWSRSYILPFLLLLTTLSSLLFAPAPPTGAPMGIKFALADFFRLGVLVGFYCLIREYHREHGTRHLVNALVAAGLIAFVTGLLGLILIPFCPFGYSEGAAGLLWFQKPTGPFLGSHELASFLVPALAVLLALCSRRNSSPLLWSLILFGYVALITMTQSRTGVAAGWVLIAIWLLFQKLPYIIRLTGITCLFLLPLGAFFLWHASCVVCPDAPVELLQTESLRKVEIGDLSVTVPRNETLSSVRREVYGLAWDLVKQSPFTGVGPGMSPNYTGTDTRMASTPITALAETGFPGALMLLAFWVYLAVRGATCWPRRLLGDLHPNNYGLLALLAASAMALFHDHLLYTHVWALFALLPRLSRQRLAG